MCIIGLVLKGDIHLKNWTINGGDNRGCFWKNWQEHSFVSDNDNEDIAKNWSAQLDKSESIQKRKWPETTYKKYL